MILLRIIGTEGITRQKRLAIVVTTLGPKIEAITLAPAAEVDCQLNYLHGYEFSNQCTQLAWSIT